MTASTPDELIAGFPHNSLPKVTGEPTFEELKIIHGYLNTNAMSVFSYEGVGRHGHLGIIMTNDDYVSLVTDVFTAPENPGATPEIANNATAAQITEANQAHKEATRVYRTYNNVDQTFKKLIIDAF
jgi:alpha-D-ribose 1-methylphosphonate 5-phosphate C-P lyase